MSAVIVLMDVTVFLWATLGAAGLAIDEDDFEYAEPQGGLDSLHLAAIDRC